MLLTKLKVLGAAALACVAVLGTVQTYAYQFGGTGAAPKAERAAPGKGGRRAELIEAVDRIQAELTESVRRNAELQKEVQALRAELEALRSSKSPVASKEERPDDHGVPKVETGKAKGGKSEPDDSAPPRYVPINDPHRSILVISPEGDRVAVYSPITKMVKTLRLSEDKHIPHEVFPVIGHGFAALMVKGPMITRLGVFDIEEETWYPIDLREPVDRASPTIGPGLAVYTFGRRIYAFSSVANRWGVLELPEGARLNPSRSQGIGIPGSITYENNGHIYTFNIETGKWDDLDLGAAVLRAILDTPEDKDDAKATPDPPRH